jgi:hypothetical protein
LSNEFNNLEGDKTGKPPPGASIAAYHAPPAKKGSIKIIWPSGHLVIKSLKSLRAQIIWPSGHLAI